MIKENLSWAHVLESDLNDLSSEIKKEVLAPAVIILTGEMGAGKTTFTRAFINRGETSSPSYSIIHEVDHFLHADFYRLESEEDLCHLEIPFYLEEKDYFLIEWGREYLDQLEKLIPEEFTYYELLIGPDFCPKDSANRLSRRYELRKMMD